MVVKRGGFLKSGNRKIPRRTLSESMDDDQFHECHHPETRRSRADSGEVRVLAYDGLRPDRGRISRMGTAQSSGRRRPVSGASRTRPIRSIPTLRGRGQPRHPFTRRESTELVCIQPGPGTERRGPLARANLADGNDQYPKARRSDGPQDLGGLSHDGIDRGRRIRPSRRRLAPRSRRRVRPPETCRDDGSEALHLARPLPSTRPCSSRIERS